MSRTIRRKNIKKRNASSVEAIRWHYISYDDKVLHRDNHSGIFTPNKLFRRKLNKQYKRKISNHLSQIRLDNCDYYVNFINEDAFWIWF